MKPAIHAIWEINGESKPAGTAADLLNQQTWCWGRDIEREGGNLLLWHGFHRIEKPLQSHASSLYRLDLSPTSRVILRGFGLFYGDERWGGLFLDRYTFEPRLTPAAELTRPIWTAEDLPRLQLPRPADLARCRRLLLDLIDWIRQYEVWIEREAGIDYRRDVLASWKPKGKTVVRAEQMALAWRLLGLAVSEQPELVIRFRSVAR